VIVTFTHSTSKGLRVTSVLMKKDLMVDQGRRSYVDALVGKGQY
jgi:hypothetical protein